MRRKTTQGIAPILVLVAAIVATGLITPTLLRWIADERGPDIDIDLEGEGPHKGHVFIHLKVHDDLNRVLQVHAAVDGLPMPIEGEDGRYNVHIDTSRLGDGRHSLTIQAIDDSFRKNRSLRNFHFLSDNTPPKVEISMPAKIKQGDTLPLALLTSERLRSISANFANRKVRFFYDDGAYRAYVPIPIRGETGIRPIKVLCEDEAGNESEIGGDISIKEADYGSADVDISDEELRILMEFDRQESEKLAGILGVITSERFWRGRFDLPLQGMVVSPFGERRLYKHFPGGYHSGVDIAGEEGDPVLASNSGRVAFVGYLKLRGNTVVIDHGWSVYTLYAHLSEFAAAVDDIVEKGDVIGRVGSTGISTGPHLHWELRVNGVSVRAMQWVEGDLDFPNDKIDR
ncbi:MAG: peptidoglycan DD-metalloendopeptidase family protein [bacterium]